MYNSFLRHSLEINCTATLFGRVNWPFSDFNVFETSKWSVQNYIQKFEMVSSKGCSHVAIMTAIYSMKFSFDATIATCKQLYWTPDKKFVTTKSRSRNPTVWIAMRRERACFNISKNTNSNYGVKYEECFEKVLFL